MAGRPPAGDGADPEPVGRGGNEAWLLEALLDMSPVAIAVLDERGRIERINSSYAEKLGASPAEVVGEDFAEVLVDPVTGFDIDLAAVAAGVLPSAVVRCRHDGGQRRNSSVVCHLRGYVSHGGARRVVVHAVEVAGPTAGADSGAEFSYRDSLLGSVVPTALLDLSGVVTEVNEAMVTYLATPREMIIGRPLDAYMSLTTIRDFRSRWPEMLSAPERPLRTRGEWSDGTGRRMWVDVSASIIRHDGRPSHAVLQLVDASAERRAVDQLDYRTRHDSLTGLPNRSESMATLQRAVAHSAAAHAYLGVLSLDVDNFTQINDALGHEAGDTVLAKLAGRLRDVLRPSDFIGRLGGDEFVVILEGVGGDDAALSLAEGLCRAARTPMDVATTRVTASVSVGVTVARGTATTGSMLREADAALRQAKRLGRNRWARYSEGMSASSRTTLASESAIRDAVNERRIEAHFQPIVDLSSGRLVGYEALARMRDESGGLAPNADFIVVAERSGLIVDVGRQVIAQAIGAASRVDDSVHVSVNAASAQLNDTHFADELVELLYANDVDPTRLTVEVTETTILELTDGARLGIDRLVALGVGLEVDDFGTGFSSLSHLRELPVTGLKLDRSFTAGLLSDASAPYRLAEGIAALARSLRLHTVAEGVETQKQRELLRASGWERGQGWLFGAATDRIFSG